MHNEAFSVYASLAINPGTRYAFLMTQSQLDNPLDNPEVFRPRQDLTSGELSEIYSINRLHRMIDLLPLPSGNIAIFDHTSSSIIGLWSCAKEEFDILNTLSDDAESVHKRKAALYESAILGGEPSSSTLARDLKAANRRITTHVPVAERGIDL